MICTERDTKIFERLERFGVLSTEQISKTFFPGIAITTVRRRLRALERADMIYRIDGLDSGGVAWTLTKQTAQKLGCTYPARRFNRNSLNHDVILSEVRNVLESAGLASNWISEHVLKAQAMSKDRCHHEEEPFVPDGLFSMTKQVVALELELNAKHRKRYETIFLRYARKKTLWRVWYLVPTETLGLLLEGEWKKIHGSKKNDILMWSLLSETLLDPWNARLRGGSASLTLKDIFLDKPPALGGAPPESGQTQCLNAI